MHICTVQYMIYLSRCVCCIVHTYISTHSRSPLPSPEKNKEGKRKKGGGNGKRNEEKKRKKKKNSPILFSDSYIPLHPIKNIPFRIFLFFPPPPFLSVSKISLSLFLSLSLSIIHSSQIAFFYDGFILFLSLFLPFSLSFSLPSFFPLKNKKAKKRIKR